MLPKLLDNESHFMHVCCAAGKQATDLLTSRLYLEVDAEF